MTQKKAEQIANQFNKRMRHLYKIMEDGTRRKRHSNDETVILDSRYVEMWGEVEPYLDHAEEVWNYIRNTNEKAGEELRFASIGAFSGWGMLEELYKRIDSYMRNELKERCKLIYWNKKLIDDGYIDTQGYKIDYMLPTSIEFYINEGISGDDIPCGREQKRLIFTVSEEIKNVLHL